MHPRKQDMNTHSYVARARQWGSDLEDRESRRHGLELSEARKRVAARAGAAPGTLENLRKGRLKDVGAALYDRLRHLMIDDLRAEVTAHEYEIAVLQRLGGVLADREIQEAQAELRQIRAVLAKEGRR